LGAKNETHQFSVCRYVVAATIPPLLPTTFTVSVGVSDVRLSQKRIACANSESILIAGKVKMAFFDKTGTLTEQGLSYQSARSATDWSASESISQDLAMAMACCHSLVRSKAGDLIGNPVDRAMITRSNARLGEEGNHTVITDSNGNRLEIVRHFDFDHHRMTQSVIVRLPSGKYVAFVKGSGESIEKLCKPESMPSDFRSSLSDSAAAGIYQISVATKPIDGNVDTITRDEVETGCSFVGVLNFLNAIRPETFDVIRELKEGSVDSVVVTGDHTLTGVKIAREAGILSFNKPTLIGRVTEGSDEIYWTTESGAAAGKPLDSQLTSGEVEIALSGAAWQVLLKNDPKHAKFMAPFIRVYGRCTPHDKVSVVDTFVELGKVTLMCGDGGNDCGALKAAHVGVALSDAEASIVSPFTSMDRTITSVVEVLREGRCALASALAVYKYISKLLGGEYVGKTIQGIVKPNRFRFSFSHVWPDYHHEPDHQRLLPNHFRRMELGLH
jgi:magnesium-transporting ATPase (P-type)